MKQGVNMASKSAATDAGDSVTATTPPAASDWRKERSKKGEEEKKRQRGYVEEEAGDFNMAFENAAITMVMMVAVFSSTGLVTWRGRKLIHYFVVFSVAIKAEAVSS